MKKMDLKHPLQHQMDNCGYNFYVSCIESLITSSNDDHVTALDGSKQVKVLLHCPSCRSNLGPLIHEILLLQKTNEILGAAKKLGNDDTKLTVSQL